MLDMDNQDGEDIIPAADEKEFVIRGTKRFERRLSTVRSSKRLLTPVEESVGTTEAQAGFFSRLMCGRGTNSQKIRDPNAVSPDESFYADCFVQLSKGRTAYRFIEPSNVSDEIADEIPVIVCLHGLTNSSYMWGDIVDLLSESEQGPQARVLVFDFYGRGRSPWNGVPITLDVLVTQTKELLDCKSPFHFLKESVPIDIPNNFLVLHSPRSYYDFESFNNRLRYGRCSSNWICCKISYSLCKSSLDRPCWREVQPIKAREDATKEIYW